MKKRYSFDFFTSQDAPTLAEIKTLSLVAGGLKQPKTQQKYGRIACVHALDAITRCLQIAESDKDAELIHRGIILGIAAERLMRKRNFRIELELIRKRGHRVRAKENAPRNKGMAEDYRSLEPEIGCLNARRRIREDYPRSDGKPFSMVQIKNILRNEGIAIKIDKKI